MENTKPKVKLQSEIVNSDTIRIYTKVYSGGNITTTVTDYPLIPVNSLSGLEHRQSGKPGLVLKTDNKSVLFKELPFSKSIHLKTGKHLCFECQHCSAASDAEGGCSKIRDFFPRPNTPSREKWEFSNCRLEKYPFITEGYEAFNVYREFLIVCKCDKFEPTHYHQPLTKKEMEDYKNTLEEKKLKLLQFFIPDVESLKDFRKTGVSISIR